MSKRKIGIIITILSLILIIFLIRLINQREIDDVSPAILCEKEYIKKSRVLWVIPNFNNVSISENKTWCSYLSGLNKTIGMHGISHEYNEFETDRTSEYMENGMKTFYSCFGFQPEIFKPPQLKISGNNKELIKERGMKLKLNWHQITRKVYHCNDSAEIFSNKFLDWI
jgi:predicted deacetylase